MPEGERVLAARVPRLSPASPKRGVATARARPLGDAEDVTRPGERGGTGDGPGSEKGDGPEPGAAMDGATGAVPA